MTRPNDRQVLTDAQVDLLNRTPIGHLSTADTAGRPHVIPFCFACDGANIYTVLDAKPKTAQLRNLRRVRNILENPRVSMVIDHYEPDWSRLWYLLIHGHAGLVETGNEQAAAIILLQSKYPQYLEMDIDQNPVIRITPDRATSWSGS